MRLPILITALSLAAACTADGGERDPRPTATVAGAADGFLDEIEGLSADEPPTDEAWAALERDVRRRVVDWAEYLQPEEWLGMKSIAFHKLESVGRPVKIDAIRYAPYREYATRVDAYMRETVHMDVMDTDGSHSTIGEPQIYWLHFLVREADHAVLGTSVGYYQQGCDMPDFDGDIRHFDTKEEAEAAGCDLSDVNWQAHGTFGADLEPLNVDYYMEWSGY